MAPSAERQLAFIVVSLYAVIVFWPDPGVHARVNAQRRTSPETVKTKPDSAKDFRLSPRFDRFFPLAESFGYAGTG